MAAIAIPNLTVPHFAPNPSPAAESFFDELGNELLRLLWDNMGTLTMFIGVYLALNYGGSLIGWVRSGFGKWDEHGQGKLF